jgi:hypothetical protein
MIGRTKTRVLSTSSPIWISTILLENSAGHDLKAKIPVCDESSTYVGSSAGRIRAELIERLANMAYGTNGDAKSNE